MARVVFFGNERIATGVTTTAPTLQGLFEAGHDIAAVVVNHEAAQSRSNRELEVATVAQERGALLLLPTRIKDIQDQLQELKADIGVLVAFGQIIPQEIIDIFPNGIANIHPSLLPKHRGSTPIESAMLEGGT